MPESPTPLDVALRRLAELLVDIVIPESRIELPPHPPRLTLHRKRRKLRS